MKTLDKAMVWKTAAVVGLFSFYAAIVLISSARLSPAIDEPIHIRSGMTMLTRGRYVDVEKAWWTRLDQLPPPMVMLPAALARWSGQSPDYREAPFTGFKSIRAARFANHIIGALILALILVWGKQIWGFAGGVLSALFLLINPYFLAHGTIVSTDLYMAFGGLIAAYCLWKCFILRPETVGRIDRRFWTSCALSGLAIGFAMLCKLSNVIFLGILPLVIAWAVWKEKPEGAKIDPKALGRGAWAAAVGIGVAMMIGIVVFEFAHQSIEPIDASSSPWAFLLQFKLFGALKTVASLRPIHPVIYLGEGFWPVKPYHFLVIYLHRMPIALLALQVLAIAGAISRLERGGDRESLAYVFALVAGISLAFITRGVYLGLRQLMLPMVLSCLVGGGLLVWRDCADAPLRTITTLAAAVGLILAVSEIALTTPWQLSYVNPLGRGQLAFMADADDGQALLGLRDWQDRYSPEEPIWLAYFGNNRPRDFGVRYRGLLAPYSYANRDDFDDRGRDRAKLDGWVAISAIQLTGKFMNSVGQPREYYGAWLDREPDFVVGGTILVFDAHQSTEAPVKIHSRARSILDIFRNN